MDSLALASISMAPVALLVPVLCVLAMVGHEYWKWHWDTRWFMASLATTLMVVIFWLGSIATGGWISQLVTSILLVLVIMASLMFGHSMFTRLQKARLETQQTKPLNLNRVREHLSSK